jgi:hypothetical protein
MPKNFERIKELLAQMIETSYAWHNQEIPDIIRAWKIKYSDEEVIKVLTTILGQESETEYSFKDMEGTMS